jgi:hypothetical protein
MHPPNETENRKPLFLLYIVHYHITQSVHCQTLGYPDAFQFWGKPSRKLQWGYFQVSWQLSGELFDWPNRTLSFREGGLPPR